MEIFRLLGRIRTEGLEETAAGLGKVGKLFDGVAAKAQEFGTKVSAAGAAMSGVGAAATANVTAPLAAVGAAALSAANDTQTATGRIQAQLGLTADEAAVMGQAAKDLWADGFGADVGEAAEAVATVGQNMKDLTQEDIPGATRNAMIFADAFGEDVSASTAAASVMMKNFGVDSERAFDLMTVGMQQGGNYSGELLDTMREYAPQFAAMGMSADDMMNTLISGAEAGAFNLDKVGDAVKEFNLLAGGAQSEATQAAFKAIGLDAAQMGQDIAGGGEKAKAAYNATIAGLASMENAQDRNIAGVALFGTQWEDLQADVVTAMGTSVNHIGNVEGATKRAGDALQNNFGARMQQAWRQFTVTLQPLGLMLMDLAERALPYVQAAVERLTHFFGSLTASQQKWIVILGIAAAAAGPLLIVLGTLMGAVGGIITGISAFQRVLIRMGSGLNLAGKAVGLLRGSFQFLVGAAKGLGIALRFLALNPIGIAITAITGLVLVGQYVYRNWDTLGPKLAAIWQRVKDWVAQKFEGIRADAVRIFSAVGSFIAKWGPQILLAISGPIGRLVVFLYQNWDSISRRTTQVFRAVWQFLVNTFNNIRTNISTIASTIVTRLVNAWNLALNRTRSIVTTLWNFCRTTFTTILNFIVRTITNLVSRVVTGWTNLYNRTRNLFTTVRNFIVNTIQSMATRAIQLATNLVTRIVNGWTNLKNRTSTLFTEMKNAVTGKIKDLAEAAGQIPAKIGKAISNKVNDATNSIKDLAEKLVKKFKEALGINSPSRVFETMGGHIIDGLTNGLSTANLKSWGLELFGDFAGGALNSLEAIKGFFSGGWTGGGAGANAAAGWIRQAMAITGVGESWFGPLMKTAERESGFNPRAINLWDSNYLAGYPSRGLFQTIPQTFAAHMMPGLNDIYNPIHNAVAAIRYMQDRYGSVFNIPGIRNLAAGGGYVGYEQGGVFTGPSTIRIAETSRTPVEAAIPLAGRYMYPFSDAIGNRIAQQMGGVNGESVRIVVEVPVNLDGREVARVIAPEIDTELAAIQERNKRATGRR